MDEKLTTHEIMKIFDCSRQYVHSLARRQGWRGERVDTTLYLTEEVLEYRDAQRRTKLIKVLGWTGRGLYRVEDIDINCSECDGFAVMWPLPPQLPDRYLCEQGHQGKWE